MTCIILSLLLAFLWKKTASLMWDDKDVKHTASQQQNQKPEEENKVWNANCKCRIDRPAACMHAWFSNRLPPLDDCGNDRLLPITQYKVADIQRWAVQCLCCDLFTSGGFKIAELFLPKLNPPQRLRRQQHRLQVESLTFPCGLKTSSFSQAIRWVRPRLSRRPPTSSIPVG